MGKYGIEIRNIPAAQIYEVNNGVREYFTSTKAMLNNSLLLDFLQTHGLRTYKDKSTRDIVCISFDYGSKSYKEERKRVKKLLDGAQTDERRKVFTDVLAKVDANQARYDKKTREELRTLFYSQGVNITWVEKYRDGKIRREELIHYRMLFRSPAKAKQGACFFIRDKLYDATHEWMTLGIQLPEENADIVGISAYQSLAASTIVGRVRIPMEKMLIVKDEDSFYKTIADVVKAEDYVPNAKKPNEVKKRCVVVREETEIKNTLWDGMGLCEDSLYPNKQCGMMLLRNRFFKACMFKTHIQKFFRDWCAQHGENYETYEVQDMFGVYHRLCDIEVITTENAIKWKKFVKYMGGTPQAAYEYWCAKLREDNCTFGIVKTDHPSKLGEYQQMSYQMINTLPCTKDELREIMADTVNYVSDLKSNPEVFADFARRNATEVNNYSMLADMYKSIKNIEFSDWYRRQRTLAVQSYVRNLRQGKVVVKADNMTICGNPFGLLLKAVGDFNGIDSCFEDKPDGAINCYCPRFADGEMLAGFRNPHNSPNNVVALRNKHHQIFDSYFALSNNIIAVDCIHADIQARLNGADFDSDFCFVTNQPTIVECAKRCYRDYPTIVNALNESGVTYSNTLADYALMDNNFSKSKLGIGWSSNIAQLAMSYYWTELYKDESERDGETLKQFYDVFVIMSVIAQVIIDSCKRLYEVSGMDIIRQIQAMPCMQIVEADERDEDVVHRKDFPKFMKYTRKVDIMRGGKMRPQEDIAADKYKIRRRINHSFSCPMNWSEEILDEIPISTKVEGIPIAEFIKPMSGKPKYKQITRVVEMANDLQAQVNKYMAQLNATDDDNEKQFAMEGIENAYTEIENKLKSMRSMSQATMHTLIEWCFNIQDGNIATKELRRMISANSNTILNLLYRTKPMGFFDNFNTR